MRTFTIEQIDDSDGGESHTVAEGLETGDGRAIVTWNANPGSNPEVVIFTSVEDLKLAQIDVPMSRFSFHWSDE